MADGRIAAGTFADPVARDLLDPPERAVVDAVREGRVPGTGADRMTWEMVRQTGLGMVPRTVAIDRAVREGGHQQVVLLGAGLDARAWRMPELATTTVWEVDHPASQQDMRRRVGDRRPVAAHVVWVPVDLASEPLAAPLESAGFDRHQPSTWVWEGVVPYLTAAQVDLTYIGRDALNTAHGGLTGLFVAGGGYLLITIPLGLLARWLENRTGKARRS